MGLREAFQAAFESDNADHEGILQEEAERQARNIEAAQIKLGRSRQQAEEAAARWYAVATGKQTPLDHHLEGWLATGGKHGTYSDIVKRQYRSVIAELGTWCEGQGAPASIEAIDRAFAGRFIMEHLLSSGRTRSTANNVIWALSSYWRFMDERVGRRENPWRGQRLPEDTRGQDAREPERPFTDAEVASLLAGDADDALHDAMRLAALTGMRIGELHALTVADCRGGAFAVRVGKTKASRRSVPVHPVLVPIVERLSEGKGPKDYLLPGGERGEGKSARYEALSGRFLRYQKKLGVYEREDEGRRRSRVNFHSWRRWFATRARAAGQAEDIIGAVLGHEGATVTARRYIQHIDELKRACVEAVTLPRKPSPADF